MALLRPLLLDNVPSIQQSAALALGRLANYSDELAEAVVSNEILPQLVYSLSEQNVSYRPNHYSVARLFQDLNIFSSFYLSLTNRFNVLEILQEGCRLRSEIGCQALASSRESRRAFWCT